MFLRNAPITALSLYPSPCRGLEAADCTLICQAICRSTSLRVLKLGVKESFDDTLDQVAAAPSLRDLTVSVDDFSDESVATIAKQLRTNTTLERMGLYKVSKGSPGQHSRPFRPIMETLETFNFTLRTVTWDWADPPQDVLRDSDHNFLVNVMARNVRIRRALEQLPGYHVAPTVLWPRVLGMVSPLPTLLYRFLRRGDVNALCSLLERDGPAKGQKKKRGRAVDIDDDSARSP